MKKILLIFSLFFTLIACEDKSNTAIDPEDISTMYGTYNLIRNEQYWANGWGGNVTIYPTGTMTCSEELAKCVFRFYDADGLRYYTNEQFKQPLNQLLSKTNLSGNVLKVSDKGLVNNDVDIDITRQDYYFEKYSDNQVPPRNTPLTTKLTPLNENDNYSIQGTFVIEKITHRDGYMNEKRIDSTAFKMNAVLNSTDYSDGKGKYYKLAKLNGIDKGPSGDKSYEEYFPPEKNMFDDMYDTKIIDELHLEWSVSSGIKYTAKKISDEDIYTSETIEPLE